MALNYPKTFKGEISRTSRGKMEVACCVKCGTTSGETRRFGLSLTILYNTMRREGRKRSYGGSSPRCSFDDDEGQLSDYSKTPDFSWILLINL